MVRKRKLSAEAEKFILDVFPLARNSNEVKGALYFWRAGADDAAQALTFVRRARMYVANWRFIHLLLAHVLGLSIPMPARFVLSGANGVVVTGTLHSEFNADWKDGEDGLDAPVEAIVTDEAGNYVLSAVLHDSDVGDH